MAQPVIGIISNHFMVNETYETHATGTMNSQVVADVMGCLPLIVPANPDWVDIDALMGVCDGFLFTGARPNVHPEEYGHEVTQAHGDFDRGRDGVALPLIRSCTRIGLPIFGVCRGFQEFNVAFGGTLHPEIRDIPGRDNHRMPPEGSLEEKFELRHSIDFTPGGIFAQILGSDQVMVNSLHGQGIEDVGDRVIVEGHAPDGTVEAIHIKDAPGFALAVQWHPEWNAAADPVSRPLFEAFRDAAMTWKNGDRLAAE
jgi:putative glutamine amidotransferase